VYGDVGQYDLEKIEFHIYFLSRLDITAKKINIAIAINAATVIKIIPTFKNLTLPLL
jgi:hypothetical protein